jgi:hypothetical protein
MHDTIDAEWLVLIHHLPPKPDYFRVRIRRRLQQLGAIPVKNAVYVLPSSEQALEDFEWLAQEIRRDGGQAVVALARWLSGLKSEELVADFKSFSNRQYDEVATAAREAGGDPQARAGAISRLEQRLEQIVSRDRFGGERESVARSAIEELRRQQEAESEVARIEGAPSGAVWVTRQNVFVDRIASAWLILRFIDRGGRFRFVPPTGYSPSPGEIRFDMFEGEYGHEGEQCTFETLLTQFGLTQDSGLVALGELVHDLDLHDEKYGRPEAAGLLALLQGITARYSSDAERIEHGRRLFDQLYAHFTRLST